MSVGRAKSARLFTASLQKICVCINDSDRRQVWAVVGIHSTLTFRPMLKAERLCISGVASGVEASDHTTPSFARLEGSWHCRHSRATRWLKILATEARTVGVS